jgi:mannose-1-phosphate guanylyltransferase/phosphomannomutase
MKAVILAAGLGTRMQDAFPNTPKAMLPMGDKPLLEHQINHLKKFGFGEIYINLHYFPDVIKNYFGNGKKFGVKIIYLYEPKILGTSGALTNFKKYLEETFIVLYGDIFTTLNFRKFLEFHQKKKSQATLLIHKTDHPEDSDLVAIDQDNRIYKFYISPHKKPVKDTNLSSAGIYILEPEVLRYLPKKIPSDFVEDFFPILLAKNFRMYGYNSFEYSKDVGTPERYSRVKEDVKTLNYN